MENSIASISELQLAIKAELQKNTYFVVHGVELLIENAKEIEYQIKSAMGACGIVASISTPSLTYKGDYAHGENSNSVPSKSPYFEMNSFNVVIVENPTLNRGRANYATALDTALQIAETLSPIPNVCLNDITQSTMGGLVVVTVNFKSNVVFSLQKEDMA